MLVCVEHKLGLVVIPKAASRTVMDAITLSGKNWIELLTREFSCLPDRRAFIREPHDRAEAAFRMYAITGSGHGHDHSSFDSFIANICRDDKNDPHVMSQMKLCAPKGELLPNSVIRWDFKELARVLDIPLACMPHRNAQWGGAKVEWSAAAREMFDEVYAEDLQLWKGNRCPV